MARLGRKIIIHSKSISVNHQDDWMTVVKVYKHGW